MKWGVRFDRTAADIAADISARRSSAVEQAQDALGRAHAIQDRTQAYLLIDDAATLAMAGAVDAAIASGAVPGPFAGVPVSIKDTEPTKGVRTTFGSLQFADHMPQTDGLVAERFRRAGGVFLAKTNTPHSAHKDVTDNLLGPACSHPMDSGLTPGGSSGGAAVSVALGVEAVSHGTDGAGSVRIPAALCGIIGFKPSSGVIPVPEKDDLWETKIHSGLLSQRVEDIALGMQAIAGPDPRDPVSAGEIAGWGDFRDDGFFKGRRVLYAPLLFEGPLDGDVRRKLDAAVATLEAKGARIETLDTLFPDPGLWFEVVSIFRRRKSFAHMAAHPELYDETLRKNIIKAKSFSFDQFLAANDQRTTLYRALMALMADVDLMVTASLPTTAWPIDAPPPGYSGNGLADPAFRWPELYVHNMTGWPAISVPCGFAGNGLPVGVQFVGKWRDDVSVLRAAWAYLEGRSSYDHLLGLVETN